MENSVGVNLECHLDLRDSARSGGDAGELELSEQVVVLCHRTLTLVDLDHDCGLVVLVGRERLRLLGGDDGISSDELCHHTSHSLDTQSQRSNIKKQQLLASLSRQDSCLHSRSVCNSLVGIDSSGGLLAAEEVLDQLLDLGDTGGSSDQDNFVHLALGESGVLHDALDGLHGLLEEVVVQLFKLSPCEGLRDVVTLHDTLNLNAGLMGG
mmetsp:Transcript_38826/g.76337  ORF Transcript_38826/g.76337 Transcript_38826/m.76337 type:complete len:210 (-) Transcript_38826:459-1088(-)